MDARAAAVASTRDRIATAARALFLARPFEDVTLAAIAAAAGVSHQTVLNHFESKDGVVLAVAELLRAETADTRRAEPGDIAGAVRALVDDYEGMGDANVRWIAASARIETLAALLDEARQGHQAWIEAVFAPHLPTARGRRRRALHALQVATDVGTWKLLRRDLGLGRAETERTMLDLAVGALRGATR